MSSLGADRAIFAGSRLPGPANPLDSMEHFKMSQYFHWKNLEISETHSIQWIIERYGESSIGSTVPGSLDFSSALPDKETRAGSGSKISGALTDQNPRRERIHA